MSDIRLAALLLCTPSCLSATAPAAMPVAAEQTEKQAILDVIARMEAAWNRGDFRGYMEGFANPDGKVAGVYRKSHIPDGPGYEEKFYFRPGNTGFKVWPGAGTTLGVGICWDQWYPETARAMMLMGAQILFYPTAIGTEPHDPELDTSRLWRRAMIGHAVSNVVPIVAANRIGTEGGQRFYGHSFICDERGDILAEFGAEETGVLVAELDLAAAKKHRAAFGFFRDRRPELYGRLVEDV